MKKILQILLLLLIAKIAIAQAPQGIPYQAAARNSSGAILASTAISVRFTIRDSIATGAIKYRETHSVTTTAQGMFSLNVGQGTGVLGTFAGINWATNAKFMQMEMDPAGGGSYIDMGTSQMMSVPYALYAGSRPPGVNAGDMEYWNGSNWVRITGGQRGKKLTFCDSIPTWGPCPPIITTDSTKINFGFDNAEIYCNILDDAGEILASGVCWSTSPHPTIGSATFTTDGSLGAGAYVSNVYGLDTNTVYYIRAYATNSTGTTYGNELIFTSSTHYIGMSYLGGILAYVLQVGEPGYIAGETHGIIAAPSDQSTGIEWGCYGTLVGGTSTTVGTGVANTAIVSAACGAGTAARLCADLVLNGYSDWYLPSKYELQKLYIYKVSIGGFTAGYYWSSSENTANNAWNFNFFYTGDPNTHSFKYSASKVRAVRAF